MDNQNSSEGTGKKMCQKQWKGAEIVNGDSRVLELFVSLYIPNVCFIFPDVTKERRRVLFHYVRTDVCKEPLYYFISSRPCHSSDSHST